MTSENSTANLAPNPPAVQNTVTVSVRMPVKLAWLIRQAAAKRDTTRSAFMAALAIREAREVMQLQREADFLAWLETAAAA